MLSLSNVQKFGMSFNKLAAIGVAVYAVIEAVCAYFFFFLPLYIDPVYRMCEEYNAAGTTCMVSLFGKTFATPEQLQHNQIILSLWDTIANIAILYVATLVVALVLALCLYKGMSFAKSYFVAFFGAKHILAMMTVLIPFANISKGNSVFGIVVAVFSLALCGLFIIYNNEEYVDDMVMTPEQVNTMNGRFKLASLLYGVFLVYSVASRMAMSAFGGYWSLYLGWLPNAANVKADTAIPHGWAIAVLLAIALIAAVMYIREGDWAMYFFGSVGVASAITCAFGAVLRFTNGEPKTLSWWIPTIMLIVMLLASVVMIALSGMKIVKKLSFKFKPEDKKPAMAVMISAGTIVLSFILTVVAITIWHKHLYAGFALGAMDFMYFIIYGAATLFLATAMLGGYDFTKFGTLGLYLMIASNNFISIFTVFSQRSAAVAAGTVTTGTNYIIAGVLFILSLVACFGIIPAFAVKGVSDYQYEKRYC